MPDVRTIDDLRERLRTPRPQFLELWASAPPHRSLCALVNGDLGWLMFLRQNGDGGLSSRNPTYTGNPDALIEYRLDNGQQDQYPAAWALPLAEVERAFEHFFSYGKPAPWLEWRDNSPNQ